MLASHYVFLAAGLGIYYMAVVAIAFLVATEMWEDDHPDE